MEFSNKWLICQDCGREFLWDAGEQSWYQFKKLSNAPKHCKDCRVKRQEDRMKRPREYSQVKCSCCGNTAYVPFIPLGIKPVYCRSCLQTQRA